jgi:hypothetical protein
MDVAVFSAFAKELEKVAGPGASAAFRALDRAGQMAGSGAGSAVARAAPRIGTFGVRTVSGLAKTAVADEAVGVANANLVTSHEDDRTPAPVRAKVKRAAEKMDRESWKQTLKDAPIVIGGTGLGYGIGKTISEQAGKHLGAIEKKPSWVKHAPLAAAMASSLASYSFGKSREAMRRRREEARARGGK